MGDAGSQRHSRLWRFLDRCSYIAWDDESPLRRWGNRHPVWLVLAAILVVPVILAVLIAAVPVGLVVRLVQWTAATSRRLLGRGRWRNSLRLAGMTALQIPLFAALLLVVHWFLRLLVGMMHRNPIVELPASGQQFLAFVVFGFGFGLMLVMAAAFSWDRDETDPRELDIEGARDEMTRNLRSQATSDDIHPFFRAPEELRIRRRIADAATPVTLLLLLNVLLCFMINSASLAFHEAHFLWGEHVFTGVPDAAGLAVWLRLILSLLLSVVPLGLRETFGFEMVIPQPVPPYGTIMVFVVNAALTWVVLAFAYSLGRRAFQVRPPQSIPSGATPDTGPLPEWVDASLLADGAWLRFVEGDYEGAAERFSRAIELEPNTPCHYHYRGLSLLQAGRPREAITDLGVAIAAAPDSPDAFLCRGQARFQLGEFDEAMDDLSAAVRIDPDAPNARAWRALVFLAAGLVQRAKDDAEEVLRGGTGSALRLAALACAFVASGDPDLAARCLTQSQESGDREPEVLLEQARALAALSRMDECVGALRDALLADPELAVRAHEDPLLAVAMEQVPERPAQHESDVRPLS